MSKRIEAIVNPQMLIWARERSGFNLIGASKRVHVKPEQLKAWETGETRPTIGQAIRMAEVYQRPLSAFYLNEPPQDFSLAMTDFRRIQDPETGEFSPGLIREIRQAQIRRDIMLELSEKEDGGEFPYFNSISIEENPNDVAHKIRDILGVNWEFQRKWYSSNAALNGWKDAIESFNVLVFHSRHVGITFLPSEAHGFSISDRHFPVIVLNSRDTTNRRIFTLIHEFCHLLLHAGGVCETWEFLNIQNSQQRLEVFCNHVSGAVLVPTSLLLAHKVVRDQVGKMEWDEEEIELLSDDFSISKEVIVRRLLTLGLTSPAFYERKREEYLQEWVEFRERRRIRGGGTPPYFRMVLRNNGKPFTSQIFYAYYENKITLSDVSDYLGAKVNHIKRMEQELFAMTSGG